MAVSFFSFHLFQMWAGINKLVWGPLVQSAPQGSSSSATYTPRKEPQDYLGFCSMWLMDLYKAFSGFTFSSQHLFLQDSVAAGGQFGVIDTVVYSEWPLPEALTHGP